MSDLVDRLRTEAESCRDVCNSLETASCMWLAADEIERLRGCEEALKEGGEIIIELKQEVERLKAKVFDLDEALAACSIIARRARKARIAFVEAKDE